MFVTNVNEQVQNSYSKYLFASHNELCTSTHFLLFCCTFFHPKLLYKLIWAQFSSPILFGSPEPQLEKTTLLLIFSIFLPSLTNSVHKA